MNASENGGKTGWPPGLLQDDCRPLHKWFASKPDARMRVREVAAEIRAEHGICDQCETYRFCSKNGCIPLTEESALTAARSSGGCTELQEEPLSRPEKAMTGAAIGFAVFCFVALVAAGLRVFA